MRKTAIFTWIWLIGSVLVSAYFAFMLFPKIYALRTSALVPIYFQTADDSQHTIYQLNSPLSRKLYLSHIEDKNFFYFSRCDTLPLSQRPICNTSNNWWRLEPQHLGCNDVMNCTATTYRLSEEERYEAIAGIVSSEGAHVSLQDLPSVSLSDPGGWGVGAKWPIFFISLFFAVKMGRAIGEFVFTPYTK